MSQRKFRRAGVASVAVTVIGLAGSAVAASAATASMTLSSFFGPSGGGNTIVGTVAGGVSAFPAGTNPVVQFQYTGAGSTACTANARTQTQVAGTGTSTTAGVLTADPGTVKRINATKIAFQVPNGPYPGGNSSVNSTGLVLVGTQVSSKWFVCVYDSDSSSSNLLASSAYTVAAKPTITSILPTSSPAAGGQAITVNGTGFTALNGPISGAIGGAALTNIKVSSIGNSFTATTGARASGTSLALTVTAPGGQVGSLDPDNNGLAQDGDPNTNDIPIPFEYTNGITITPNTAPLGTVVSVDVTGAGFSSLTFAANDIPVSNHAHVFLVEGAYVPGTNRGVAECEDAAVVSDTELACTLDLSANQLRPTDSTPLTSTPIDEAAYTLTVVADGSTTAGGNANPTIVSSGATFTVGAY
jgi:hypothetical protein